MRRILVSAVALISFSVAGTAFAASTKKYDTIPADNAQYAGCLKKSQKKYDGGSDKSKVSGQTKSEAWCTCMLNETPADSRSDVVKFAESSAGAEINKNCEKYSGWK
jgi:hypothetical protein